MIAMVGIGGASQAVEPRQSPGPVPFRIGNPDLRGDDPARSEKRMLCNLSNEMQTDRRDHGDIAIKHGRGAQPGRHERHVMFKDKAIPGQSLQAVRQFARDVDRIEKRKHFGQHGSLSLVGMDQPEVEETGMPALARPCSTRRVMAGGDAGQSSMATALPRCYVSLSTPRVDDMV